MSEHTPEPWELGEVGDKIRHFCPAKDGTSILTVALEYDNDDWEPTYFGAVYSREDARRIVACVNACAGMADPAAEIAKLRAERDKLMAALTRLASPYSFTAFGLGRWYDDESLARMIYARAALAENGE